MRSRLALLSVALLSALLVACPMPQVGKGPTKDLGGGTGQAASPSAGATISVVNDDARNQAVYINENGQRFDVVAEEYPGGPLVSCVQMADFTLIPASTDPDALPVKALVAGTRDDGTPGIWEIHSDDTIQLPQPATDDPTAARCIVGGDMTSLPGGVQIRLGWGFHVTAVSPDGKMIVGYADNPKGTTIGGVRILPGTTIAVYWRVSSQHGNRFCTISAPHIIGSFSKQPLPDKWARHWRGRSDLLEKLHLYMTGTLQSYLVKATSVRLSVPQGMTTAAATSAGVYDVMGTNEDGLPALAKIDKNGGVIIQVEVPDLAVSGVTVSTSSTAVTAPAFTDDHWSVSATVTNQGTAAAVPVTVQYWLSSSATFDPTTAKLLDTSTVASLAAGATITVASPQTYSVAKLDGAAGTYYVAVTVATDSKLGEIDLSDNQSQASITVQSPATSSPVLSISAPSAIAAVSLGGAWAFDVTVLNTGAGAADPTTLQYLAQGKTVSVTIGAIGPKSSLTYSLSGNVRDLTTASGTFSLSVTANAGSVVSNTAVVTIPVSYSEVIIDTYDPVDGASAAGNANYIELWSFDGTTRLGVDDGAGEIGRSPNQYYARIDKKDGLAPGDYWVLIRASSLGDSFGYGIRLLTAPSSSYSGWTFPPPLPAPETVSDQPVAETGGNGIIPTTYQTIVYTGTTSDKLYRYVTGTVEPLTWGVNWVKIHLP